MHVFVHFNCEMLTFTIFDALPITQRKGVGVSSDIGDLSARERQALYLVYQLAPASAADIQEQLESSYNATRRILEALVQKKFVTYEKDGRRYIYRPLKSPTEEGTKLLREVIKAFFSSSPSLGFIQLIESARGGKELSKRRLEEIRKILEEAESDQDAERHPPKNKRASRD